MKGIYKRCYMFSAQLLASGRILFIFNGGYHDVSETYPRILYLIT